MARNTLAARTIHSPRSVKPPLRPSSTGWPLLTAANAPESSSRRDWQPKFLLKMTSAAFAGVTVYGDAACVRAIALKGEKGP